MGDEAFCGRCFVIIQGHMRAGTCSRALEQMDTWLEFRGRFETARNSAVEAGRCGHGSGTHIDWFLVFDPEWTFP